MKFSREKSDESFKPFGYAVIEHSVTDEELIDAFLKALPPILVCPIPGPRYIGSEHVQLMKRYVVCTPLKEAKLSKEFFKNTIYPYAQNIMFDITEYHKDLPLRPVRKVHLLFRDASSVERFHRHYLQTDGNVYSLLRAKDHQASRFQAIESPFEVSSYRNSYPSELSAGRPRTSLNRHQPSITSLEKARYPGPVPGENDRMSDSLGKEMSQISFISNPKASKLSDWTFASVSKPAMNFKSKKLHCTINNSQLERLTHSLCQNHATANLRFNVIVAR